jgi:hypothetical protein
MEEKTLKALHWIVSILNKYNVPYRIGGGFAAHMYGSDRKVNDIDFSLSGKYFPIIMSEISEYVEYDLKHYSNEKWDCDGLTLNYFEQEIDMTDIDTLRMSDKELTKWFQTKDNFRRFPNFMTVVDGIEISLIDPRDLVAYKKELADDDHQYQLDDIIAVEKYIKNHNLYL